MEENNDCQLEDIDQLFRKWGSGRFISNGSNCDGICVDVELTFNSDSTYILDYIVLSSDSSVVNFQLYDTGNFESKCIEARTSSSPWGDYRRINWEIKFDSDSIQFNEWDLEYNGIEGLIIKPEFLQLNVAPYLMLVEI